MVKVVLIKGSSLATLTELIAENSDEHQTTKLNEHQTCSNAILIHDGNIFHFITSCISPISTVNERGMAITHLSRAILAV